MFKYIPGYIRLLEDGELPSRVEKAYKLLQKCDVCAWKCPVNRAKGQLGICKTGLNIKISSYGAHLGEEKPLRGWLGSGTIFFTRCNLRCQYCQNHDISQTDDGIEVSPNQLAKIMVKLQSQGCHNINFVSPTHVAPQIIEAVLDAAKSGLAIPLVYNTGGYDSIEMLRLLDGVIDIYMPDMKYSDNKTGKRLSKVKNYPAYNRLAVKEMHKQVGDLIINERGLAQKGLLIRHLILPNNLAGTKSILSFIAKEISQNSYVNLMDQYYPAFRARKIPDINRRITQEEYINAKSLAYSYGLYRLDD